MVDQVVYHLLLAAPPLAFVGLFFLWPVANILALGIAPALALADEEEKFRTGDDAALDRAAGIQRASYESGTAPAMIGIGAALAVVGAGAAIGGVMWAMGAGE
jgi:hypothetical protein